jgi:hypothetical protein
VAVTFGLIGLVGAVILGYLGHISVTDQTFFGKRYHISQMGWPTAIDEDAPQDDTESGH